MNLAAEATAYPEKTLKTVAFGAFTFDPHSGLLKKGHRTIHLRPLAVRLLEILLTDAGEVVRREELREALWGDRVVEWESGLHRLIQDLRTALGDDARHPKYIRTAARKGYGFCAAVVTVERQSPAKRPKLLRTTWFVSGALSLPGIVIAYCLYLGLTT